MTFDLSHVYFLSKKIDKQLNNNDEASSKFRDLKCV